MEAAISIRECTELDFNNPDWKKLAESFEWNFIYEDKSDNLSHRLKETKDLKGPTLFVIPIDYSENQKLTSYLDSLEKAYEL